MGCSLLEKYGSCSKCMEGAPFHFCCRKECGEHQFCTICIDSELERQKRLKQKNNNEREHKSSN